MNKKPLFIVSGLMLVAATALSGCTSSTPATRKWSEKDETITFRQIRSARGYNDLKSDGRTLIIPVQFADYQYTELYGEKREEDGARKDIYNVNFGADSETQWESLSSFYGKSSYGQAHLTGAVGPWFTPYEDNALAEGYGQPYTVKSFAENHAGYRGATFVLEQALRSLKKTGYKNVLVKDENGNFVKKSYASGKDCVKDFDGDHDGLIDNIQLVYTCPPHVKDEKGQAIDDELFWAFRSLTGWPAKVDEPNAYNYLWLSYETFFENGTVVNGKYRDYTEAEKIAGVGPNGERVLDAHTLIHETGHALGAEDYYTNTSKDYAAAAQFIMMAHNVGDHDCWTKLLYGWVDPTVVYGNTTITLDTFQKNGDCVLIPTKGNWSYNGGKHTVGDEYIMLEYFTDEGLYHHDLETPYLNSKTFYGANVTTTGLRIWHIDARLASFSRVNKDDNFYTFIDYADDLVKMDDGYTYFGAFNDRADAVEAKTPNRDFKLISCVNITTSNSTSAFAMNGSGKTLSDDNILSEVGSSLNSKDWEMNSGKKFGYNITILEKTDSTITIKIG